MAGSWIAAPTRSCLTATGCTGPSTSTSSTWMRRSRGRWCRQPPANPFHRGGKSSRSVQSPALRALGSGGLARPEPGRTAGPGARVRRLDAPRLAVRSRARVSRVQILQVPDYPLVGRVREMVRRAFASAGVQAEVEELTGEYASPTMLVDSVDVTGRPAGSGSPCRFDLSTEQQIVTALQRRHAEPHERRNDVEHNNDAGLAEFEAAWRTGLEHNEWITVTYAVIGLTNFGERPVQSVRLAEVLGRYVTEAEALAQQWGWPGTRVEDGLISVDSERARPATRRRAQVGDRGFGVTGCAGDIF